VSSYSKMIDMQEGMMMDQASPTKNVGTLSTDISSYYSSGPTVGEDDLDDPWDETHSETEQVSVSGVDGDHTTSGNSNNNGSPHEEVEGDDSEYEDKFHCRPRYQHTRVDVRAKFYQKYSQ